jgi:hypothetical protein
MEVSMSALIAIATLLVVVANGLFALHIWSGFSDPAQRPAAGQ